MTAKHVSCLALLIALAWPYACSPVYRFDEPRPFAGTHILNPYANMAGRWQRVNLHAHGIAWGGLTNGKQPSAEVVRTYRALGYDVAGVSNYHSIATAAGVDTLPVYEHGYNISKRHQLAIGARRVAWFDIPLWQGLSHQQFVIDRVKETADLVALVHPLTRDAYGRDNLRWLTRYELIEIVNGPFRSEAPWDAALSSGHAVWALGNDDTHDTDDPRRTAAAWTMVDAPSATTSAIVSGLRAGRAYTVSRNGNDPAPMDLTVTSVDVTDDTLRVTSAGPPATFTFVGQNGVVRSIAKDVTSASYALEARDTYIRTIVTAPRTTVYLNPVLRYDGRALSTSGGATVAPGPTWTLRGTWCGGLVLLSVWLLRRLRTTDHRSPAAVQALPRADRETA